MSKACQKGPTEDPENNFFIANQREVFCAGNWPCVGISWVFKALNSFITKVTVSSTPTKVGFQFLDIGHVSIRC